MALNNVNSSAASDSEGDNAAILLDSGEDDDQLQDNQPGGLGCILLGTESESEQWNGDVMEENSETEQPKLNSEEETQSAYATTDVDDNCVTDLKLRILELEGQNQVHEQTSSPAVAIDKWMDRNEPIVSFGRQFNRMQIIWCSKPC